MENSIIILNINEGLKTYSGRDACIRLVAYFFLLLFGILKQLEYYEEYILDEDSFFKTLLSDSIKSCLTISKNFSTARLILRFFDDIPAILKFFNYLELNKNQVI